MLVRALLVLAVCIPLPACTTTARVNGMATLKAETRKVCTYAGQAFGWDVVDVLPTPEPEPKP